MDTFAHDGFDIAFETAGADSADPILLIHGFASSYRVNWLSPGWVKTLNEAGYRTIGFDHRGHGQSSKSYDPDDYTPSKMAADAAALLDHLGIARAHVMGYSMGARVSAFMGLEHKARVHSLIFGGLGIGMVSGVGDWDPIAEALNAGDASAVTHPRGKMFRTFADQTKSDRKALAACISQSRQELSPAQMAQIAQPTLIAVGTRDDIGGSPSELAALMPNAEAFDIENRDHMLSVGDRAFKRRALDFLAAHPIV